MTIIVDTGSSFHKWENKERAVLRTRAEGPGGSGGIVLSLDMVSTSYFAVAYTVPVQLGSSQQNFSLQVDTGSSDLWVAARSCSSSPCSATDGRLYDPSSSQPTDVAFSMHYVAGDVSGPVVLDQVQIGDYVVPIQALAAATTIDDEPLSSDFDGILGLALPLNSQIQYSLSAGTGNTSDGAAISSNLFSITDAPSQAFFSLSLARPGSNDIPSLLGIGRHPAIIVPDPSKISYSPLVSESAGQLFWKTTVRAITIYINGQAHPIALESLSGALQPTALLDSGIPVILTTPIIANGIYGALGIGPASDGNYYVPCQTPINMTISLTGQNELPIHPLDLTTEPTGQSRSEYCMGLIQTDPMRLTATSDIGDIVLGVPFMRNVYTVMGYEQPNSNGVLNASVQHGTRPTLGLLGLTNATQAMEEFNQVRVLNKPLDGGQSKGGQPPSSSSSGQALSVGVEVLIALVGFFALCVVLFALRYFFSRRRWWRASSARADNASDQKLESGAYQLTRRNSQSSMDESPDTLRTFAYDSPRKKVNSQYTVDSNRTYVEGQDTEFGVRRSKHVHSPTSLDISDPWDPYADTWRDTIIGTDAGSAYLPQPDLDDFRPSHGYTSSELTSVPLLAHERNDSQESDAAEFGMHYMGMAGIGTAARGSMIDPDLQHSRSRSDSSGRSVRSSTPLRPTGSALRESHVFIWPSDQHHASPDDDAERTFGQGERNPDADSD